MTGAGGDKRRIIGSRLWVTMQAPWSSPPAMSALKVLQIDHVTCVVKDLEQSRKFYADLLGMHVVPRPGFSFPGLWFQAGSTQIHLILEGPDSGPAQVFIPENCSISRTRHVAFEVASAEEHLSEMSFLTSSNRYASGDRLRYENAMLDDWFEKRIQKR